MKKLIVVLLSAMLVLGFAVSAMADITLSGDARVRGISHSDYDFDGDVDSATGDKDHRWYDQRVRLYATGTTGDIKVMTRFTISEGDWNGAKDEAGGGDGGYVNMDDDDYAYIIAPVGPVQVHVGRQLFDWGNKFAFWNVGVDRLKVYYTVSDTLKLGALTDKNVETEDGENSNDTDSYALLGVGKIGEFNAGVVGIYSIDGNDPGDDIDGQVLDVYFSGPAGPVALAGELTYKGGDMYEIGTSDSAQLGAFVAGSMNFDALTGSLALAYASDDFTSSKYFTPSLFFGTSQATAVGEFGAGDDGTTFAVVAGLDYKASDMLGVGGKLLYASFDEHAFCTVEDSCSAFEIDLSAKYKLGENTMYYVDLGALMPSDFTDNDETALGLAHRVELKF